MAMQLISPGMHRFRSVLLILAMLRALACGGFLVGVLNFAGQPAMAQDQGPFFELVEVVPDATYDTWPSVTDGHVSQLGAGGNYKAEFSWSSPPQSADMSGFSVTLNVQASAPTARIAAGTGMSSTDFSFDPSEANTNVLAEVGESKSDSKTIKVTPPSNAADGSIVELRVGAAYGPGVTYRYKVSSTPVAGSGGNKPQKPQNPQLPASQLSATLDCPGSIVISAPDLNCHLIIANFRHNTADAIQVILPAALDTFGNHANGIQLDQLAGEQDVYGMDDPYSWGFFAFACPARTHNGHNCYNNVATPGAPATVPIIIKQGEDEVRIDLMFSVLPATATTGTGGNGNSTGAASAGQVVRVGNRWIAGSFLNVESGTLANTGILLDWLSARWTIEPVVGTNYVRLHNVWKPDSYIHIEFGDLEAGPIDPSWQSAMWQMQPIGDSGYYRFMNAAHPEQYLNTQPGTLQSSTISNDWLSAMWWLLR
jgi:hypothetical protein